MKVRRATRVDLVPVGRIANAAYWESYRGLLTGQTISALLQRDYSPASISRRILRGSLLVAEGWDGSVVGFADASVDDDHMQLTSVSTDPPSRRHGVGTSLVRALHQMALDLPVCADVVLGNDSGEGFYEALGFAPGEVVTDHVDGDDLVSRRWWLAPPASLGSRVS